MARADAPNAADRTAFGACQQRQSDEPAATLNRFRGDGHCRTSILLKNSFFLFYIFREGLPLVIFQWLLEPMDLEEDIPAHHLVRTAN
ncbi:hypothetical protein WJ0W_005586 [Paenibacillus melissococcoides]|uniref:Uncharacterized protein n=1 Tax=Paenibacillus melissococcoides TaxID=2912268 RepID=A0ABM9G9H1_9BACL|nr:MULTISPECIES: hypothetical protein [Paenibacillus]MEB9896608.1 hypothetical protein [Bacillus cereus]CAH8248329.1 hypothetical protein WJ0W_005586 [Paenibacillus melissococcoides]CAH8717808.1 hypothetical protein HTL2_005065 [Paenibacillus melissococcoides]CAH8719316.1 hypothetical protein WDD9_005508 [Paenibacillus melissococcoides]